MRVLVIEDSDVDFRLLERALGDPFTLFRAPSLAKGLAMAAGDQYDLVILDLTLEDSRGYETFEKARAALTGTPIMLLSGIEDEELALRAVSNGAQDYIGKSRLLEDPVHRAARYAIQRWRADEAARKASLQLRESERFAKSIVNSLAAHIAILDQTGKILAVNSAWHRFAEENGLSSTDRGVGMNYLEACEHAGCREDDVARAAAVGIRSVLEGGRNEFYLEYPCHSPAEERWCAMRVTPFDGDGPTRVVVSHEDITSRKLAERLAREQWGLREAVAGMEQVLGVVGHELRTPLAALRAISEFLTTDGARDTAEANGFLRNISEEVDRMSETVNNLLEAARLNSGRARWNWSEFDLADIVEEAISSMQPLVDATPVLITADVHRPIQMRGDSDAIRRLVINLLSNARKHTLLGRIVVGTRQETNETGAWIELTVTDTGCGISSDVAARLGEAFALNSGVVGNNHVSGTGLGLAICKAIATAHGGKLRIESIQKQGTTVTARLCANLERAASGDTIHTTFSGEVAA